MTPRQRLGAWLGAGALTLTATSYIAMNEGTVLPVYRDPVNILTACTGETHYVVTPGDIKPGAVFTPEQCTEALFRSEAEHAEFVIKCTSNKPLTVGQKIAFLDFTYNTGGKTFCQSSMAKRATLGEVKGSCDAILYYKFAGGRDCSRKENEHICGGVWRRRMSEYRVCLGDLPT